jgi:hypothetical protein
MALMGVTLWTALPAQAERSSPSPTQWVPEGVIRWSNRNAKVVEMYLTTDELCDVNAVPVPDSCVSRWRVQAKRRAGQHVVRVECIFRAYQLSGTTHEVHGISFSANVSRGDPWTLTWNYVYATSRWRCTARKLPL